VGSGDHRGADASEPSPRESMAPVSVNDAQGAQVGEHNVQVNIWPRPSRRRTSGPSGKSRSSLPAVRSAASGAERGDLIPLSPDVQEKYLPVLSAALAPHGLPVNWTFAELSELRRKAADCGLAACRAADVLKALCQAASAKPLFLAAGGGRLELGQLQVIYEREIGTWPDGASADALLVEAASAGIMESRSRAAEPLGALARLVVGVAAALKAPFGDGGPLAGWVGSLGHQFGDALALYNRRQDDPAWLVIDFGDEPRPGASSWPDEVVWMLLTGDQVIPGDPVPCEPTPEGARLALTRVMRMAPPARPLLVDLAVPRALMDAGIEHWPVVDMDDSVVPLSAECRPRLRWSRRRRNVRLRNKLLDRVARSSWDGGAKDWMRNDKRWACFLGGRGARTEEDPLGDLLKEGGAFAIWFPGGLPPSIIKEIAKAVRKVPVQARRRALPDHLPSFTASLPAIIWDEPEDRHGIWLPPIVVPESPS
jgi:hypothetical protein